MANTRLLLLRPQTLKSIVSINRSFSTTTSHHNDHNRNQEYLTPNTYLNSWTKPTDPKQALSNLHHLRRDYAKKVKAVRKEYIYEMELLKAEKQRKDEIKKEALRIQSEERRAAKDVEKKAKAAERKLAQEEFRQTLLKERAEKLEYHKKREQKFMEKKKEKNELLRRQSSIWIDENELEKKIQDALYDHTPL
ncbi:hypothetical protein CTI12_AA103640 [Artemisia annua]|uniref:Uncharacterized protein n=1 Tax=Artemisia annua TaxID=35608 RepID=A0A2U1PS81_ARTAN|nr:hypothetical protein CTI12_AA103640 [Artemisia annua]